MSSFFPEPGSPHTDSAWVTWLASSATRLLPYLHTDEVVYLGWSCTRLREVYLSHRIFRKSIQVSGPTEPRRFGFWRQSLRVELVQRELFPSEEGGGPLLDEELADTCKALFRTVLLGNNGNAPPDGSGVVYSGKRMLNPHGQEGEILRDVTRTFPTEALFRDSAGVGQNLLANVLKACLNFHDDVGYCQGMNYVVATFLFSLRRRLLPPIEPPPSSSPSACHPHEDGQQAAHAGVEHECGYTSEDHSVGSHASVGGTSSAEPSPTRSGAQPTSAEKAKKRGYNWECTDEQMNLACEVFWLMTALMAEQSGLNMRMLWHPEVPHMKLRVFQFDRIMAAHAPRLHAHFRAIRLAPDILVSQWLTTLLAYCLPLRVLVRVWDMVFLDGWKALFRICLALLLAVEEDMLPLNLEESGRFLRMWTSKRHPLWRDPVVLLRAASRIKITRSMLEQLREEFHLTLLKEQLAGADTGEWLSRYGPGSQSELLKASELEGLKKELKKIEAPMTADFTAFRKKIEVAGARFSTATKRLEDIDAHLLEVAMQTEELEEVKQALQSQVERIISLCNSTSQASAQGGVEDLPPGVLLHTPPSLPPAPTKASRHERSGTMDSGVSSASTGSHASRRSSLDLAGMTAVLSRLMDCLSVPDHLVRCQAAEDEDRDMDADLHQHHQDGDQQLKEQPAGSPPDDEEVLRHLYQDLYVQEKKISKAAAQLASLRLMYQSLQAQRVEAEVALDEAETLRAAVSKQLMQVLQETEERVNRKMKEVIRSQPSSVRASVPSSLSPNKQALLSARSARRASAGSPDKTTATVRAPATRA